MTMLTPPRAGRRIPVADGRMVEAATETLRKLGLATADVHADIFFTPETSDARLILEATS